MTAKQRIVRAALGYVFLFSVVGVGVGAFQARPGYFSTVFATISVSDPVGTMATIRAGGLVLASQAPYDVMYASSSTQWARVPNGTTGQVLTATTSAAPAFRTPAVPTVIRSNSGSSNSVVPVDLDSATIANLTSLDTLVVVASIRNSSGNNAKQPSLYDSTDGISIAKSPSNADDTTGNMYRWTLRQDPNSIHGVFTIQETSTISTNAMVNTQQNATLTVSWQGSWTMSLRFDGVTGGSCTWSWAVYKWAGQ